MIWLKSKFNHRAIATFIEVLAFLYWFFNTLQKYIYVQNSSVLFWKHFFFHNDALPSTQKKRKLFCTKSVGETCEKWNMRMYSKWQSLSAMTRFSTNHEEKTAKHDVHENLVKLIRNLKKIPIRKTIVFPCRRFFF